MRAGTIVDTQSANHRGRVRPRTIVSLHDCGCFMMNGVGSVSSHISCRCFILKGLQTRQIALVSCHGCWKVHGILPHFIRPIIPKASCVGFPWMEMTTWVATGARRCRFDVVINQCLPNSSRCVVHGPAAISHYFNVSTQDNCTIMLTIMLTSTHARLPHCSIRWCQNTQSPAFM